MLTNQDTGLPVILDVGRIVRVDDVGSFRTIIYQANSKECAKVYVVEEVLEIWKLCNIEGR
jgi:hypothetical protein